MVAEADVTEARLRLEQTREQAALETRNLLATLDAARAVWEASVGTVEQATRAYEIAEVRFREGISTQTELSDARLLLVQAQANRAIAARDLQVVRINVMLLHHLPFGSLSLVTPPTVTRGQPQ
jgi:outer membrane protein TolC